MAHDAEIRFSSRRTTVLDPALLQASWPSLTKYEYNDAGWITSASDSTRVRRTEEERLRTAFRYEYDQRGSQTRWRSEHAGEDDRGRDMRWTYWPNGAMKRRSATKTRADGSDETTRSYGYGYNGNGSLVEVEDSDAVREQSGAQPRRTTFGRDAAERETRVDETWRGGHDVQLDYDAGATGWLTRRRTDGDFSPTTGAYGGTRAKATTFDHDSLGREVRATVDPAQGDDRVTRTRWFGGGQMRERTKPNGTRDEWRWDGIGRKARHDRIPDGETEDPSPQTYAYDTNGNRTRDERGTHVFNAREQLVRWERPDQGGRADRRGWSTSYSLNGSGAMVGKVERDSSGAEKVTTALDLDGDRLESAEVVDRTQAVRVTTTQTFRYDDVGNMQRAYTRVRADGDVIIEDPPAPPKTALNPTECPGTGDVTGTSRTTRYCYDEFNRQVFASGSGTDGSYTSYDGLDRRDRRVKRPTGSEAEQEGRNYTYLGSSELLASEDTTTAGQPSSRRVSFDYDSAGDRLGQQRDEGDASVYRAFAKDANGSVTGLENGSGVLGGGSRYAYDPYGESDRPAEPGQRDDPDAGLDVDTRANLFRFEGFYFDSGVGSYDMHARQYQPDLGRFLSRDTYASAAGDQALSADPLTQNRYAFAGGNPVNLIEFDGHCPARPHCGGKTYKPTPGGTSTAPGKYPGSSKGGSGGPNGTGRLDSGTRPIFASEPDENKRGRRSATRRSARPTGEASSSADQPDEGRGWLPE